MQRRFLDKHLTECRERIVQCTLCEEEFAFWRLKVIACRDDVLENYNMNFVEAFSLMPTPRVAISFFFCLFFCYFFHHTQISLYLKITYIVHHYKSYWLHWFVGHNTIAQEGHLLDKRRASIRLFTVSGAVMTVFCRRGCISIASQTVDKGVNCVTIIICSKKISAQNMTWQLTKSAE